MSNVELFENMLINSIVPKRIMSQFNIIRTQYLLNIDVNYSVLTLHFYKNVSTTYELSIVINNVQIYEYGNGMYYSLKKYADKFPEWVKYNNLEERTKLLTYAKRMHYLFTETDYPKNLPTLIASLITYTFLICNKKNNTFCRDITKNIVFSNKKLKILI